MNTYTIDALRQGVAQYLGLGTFPAGNAQGYDASIQSGMDYCWRFTDWAFTIKRDAGLVKANSQDNSLEEKYYMPVDFDILGWRKFKGLEEYNTKDAVEFEEEHHLRVDGVYLEFDKDNNRFRVLGKVDDDTTVSYQVTPPNVSTDLIYFPMAQPIIMAAAIYQKMKEHPNSADIRQEWNMLDALLSQMASKNNRNTPLHKPRDRYEQYGTYTGDTR